MMSASLSQFSDGDRALLALGQCFVPETMEGLWRYLPDSRQEALAELRALSHSAKGKQETSEEREATSQPSLFPHKRNLLYEAEGSWIAEKLSEEDSVVLAVALNQLPKARMGGVLRCLSKEMRRRLKGIQIEQIPLPLQTWLLQRAESFFPRVEWSELLNEELFRHLMDLDWKAFQALLRELGLTELSLALGQMARSSLRAILHRLPLRDAKEIKMRIQNASETEVKAQREAQVRLLTVDLEQPQSAELIEEIGLAFLSRAFGKEDQGALELFVHRFPPKQGYVLKRYFSEHRGATSGEALASIRKKILLAVAQSAFFKES